MKKSKNEDEYYPPVTYKYDGITVKVYRPILTEQERKRRMQQIANAAARFIMSKEIKDPVALSRIRAEIIECDSN